MNTKGGKTCARFFIFLVYYQRISTRVQTCHVLTTVQSSIIKIGQTEFKDKNKNKDKYKDKDKRGQNMCQVLYIFGL